MLSLSVETWSRDHECCSILQLAWMISWPIQFLDPWNTALDLPISSSSPQAPTPSSPSLCMTAQGERSRMNATPSHLSSTVRRRSNWQSTSQTQDTRVLRALKYGNQNNVGIMETFHIETYGTMVAAQAEWYGRCFVTMLCCYHCWPTLATTNAWSVILERAAEVNNLPCGKKLRT